MGMKVGSCLHLSQPTVPHSPSSQTPASVISLLEQKTKPSSSSSSTSKSRCFGDYSTLVWGSASSSNRSSLFGTGPPSSNKLLRTRSYGTPKNRGTTSLRRSCSASLSNLFDEDEEFSKTLDELSLRFEVEESSEAKSIQREGETGDNGENFSHFVKNRRPFVSRLNLNSVPPWLESRPEPPDWPVKMTNPVSLEIRANSVELPLSLRMIKRKQWYERATSLEEGFSEAGETACCSVKKAFSSMVFMIRELQSFTLRMRQFLFYEDLQEILVRVQKEMQASFVWLFQQVFSCTPTLMVYVMILLANFTVYSMGKNTAFASAPAPPPESYAAAVEVVESRRTQNPKHKSKDFSVSAGKFNVSGDGGGSGGKSAVVAGSADGDGQFDQSYGRHRSFFNDEASPVSSVGNPIREAGEEAVAAWEEEEEWDVLNVNPSEQLKDELKLWNRVVEEASRMQACSRNESLDDETIQMLVSPVAAEMEREDYDERYFRTELLYQQAIANEPDNPLLLCNYAQFLFLAVHDHDRAEEYFKRAVRVYPPDAESLDRYANFLWLARKDLTAAEETFLAAIEAEPGNTFHAANYAHFLWNTGGEDTCFPLDSA